MAEQFTVKYSKMISVYSTAKMATTTNNLDNLYKTQNQFDQTIVKTATLLSMQLAQSVTTECSLQYQGTDSTVVVSFISIS